MKNNTWILLKAQLLNQSGVNKLRYEKDKKKKNKAILFIATMAFVWLVLALYSFGLGYGLGSIGLSKVIPGYTLTLSSLLILFFTLFKSSGTLFAFRDYDMLMALPVQTTAVIASRFLLMYILNVLFSLVIVLPMGVAYCLWVHPQIAFYGMWLIALFVIPLVPMTIAAVFGALISAISSRFKHTNAINIVLSFVLTIGLLGASMSAGTMNASQINIVQLASFGTQLSQKMNQLYPLAGMFEKALCQYDVFSFLLFVAISVAWYYAFVKIVSIRYKAINTALTSHQARSNYKMQSLPVASPFQALYRKEMKRFFSSYLYVLNMGIGAVLLLIGTIACFILGIDKIEQLFGIPDLKSSVLSFVPFVISMMLAMTCTTAVSLSLEGKNLWIMQSAPVRAATIYRSKMAVNLTLLLPVSLLSSFFMSLCLKPDLLSVVWMLVTPLAYVGLTCVWGMYINLKLPNFTWESEITVIKQSMSSMLGILGGMLFGSIPIGILLLLPGMDRNLLTGVVTFAVIGITLLLYKKVCGTKLPS